MISTPVGDFPDSISTPGTGIISNSITALALEESITTLFSGKNRSVCLENIDKEKATLSWETFTTKILEFVKGI